MASDYNEQEKERLSIAVNKLTETWCNNYFALFLFTLQLQEEEEVAHAESKT